MAGQSKMQFLDLDHELIVLIISRTTLLHQFTHRRVSKNFKKIIEENVWLNCKRLPREEFPGTYFLPMDQICQAMLPKMPHLEKLPLRYSRKPGKNESIIDLASRYCHEISYFGDNTIAQDYVKRYLINLQAQSVPVDHLKIQFFVHNNEELSKLRDLPESIPIHINLDAWNGDVISLSNHAWLDKNRVCKVIGRMDDMTEFKIPPKVTSLDTDKLDEAVLKFRNQLKSVTIYDNCLDNLKYFDHLTRLEIHLYSDENENENFKKFLFDNLESFLLGNGKTVTHFSFSSSKYYDDLLSKIASINRDTKWRYLHLRADYFDDRIIFKDSRLSILIDAALDLVSETLSLANNCHRLKFISIYDRFCYTKDRRYNCWRRSYQNVKDNQIQSWKSMMMTLASDKKNCKIELELFVDNPDEDNISGDNWSITQIKRDKWFWELSLHERRCIPTVRAANLLTKIFETNYLPHFP